VFRGKHNWFVYAQMSLEARSEAALLCAFDPIELDARILRRSSIEYRKQKLAKLVVRPQLGIVLNEHYEGDGGAPGEAGVVLPVKVRSGKGVAPAR
jgi:hypothetical protein